MRLIFAIATLYSACAYAVCPNLAGTWSCTDNVGGLTQSTITQAVKNGVVIYNLPNATIVDGQSHPTPPHAIVNSYTASCTNSDDLDVLLQGPYNSDGYNGTLAINIVYSLQGTQMNIRLNSNFTPANGGPDKAGSSSSVCTPVL